MRIVLIGNYPPDGQESMQRFAHMLATGFRTAGFQCEIWQPGVLFGAAVASTTGGLGKWLGYLDKWVLFPIVLRWRRLRHILGRGSEVRYHVCDHSNAPYLNHLPARHTAITCHDVLAIRGGLGHADAHVAASRLGRLLQSGILRSLSRARRLASVSQLTLDQLRELAPGLALASAPQDWRVIHNAFNADFQPMPAGPAQALLTAAGLPAGTPFLLHVGSDLPRKNRRLLLDMAATLGPRWGGSICFAGAAPEQALLEHAARLGLRERVVAVVKPDHPTLVALYSRCAALVFPSLSEGFGWPVIEAQACGAPVLASSTAPMPEVSGGAALHAPATDARAFADAFLTLEDAPTRAALIRLGLANCRRFEPAGMMQAYLDLLALPSA